MQQSHTSLSFSKSSRLLFRCLVLETKNIVLARFVMRRNDKSIGTSRNYVPSLCGMCEIRHRVSGFDKAFDKAGQYHHRQCNKRARHALQVGYSVVDCGGHACAVRPRLRSLFSPQPKTVPLVDSAKVEFLKQRAQLAQGPRMSTAIY